ncbi:hypothetical protein FACS1894190_01040 [Spirochaetia bacterium]|nr:hypothetical protein FACS1894190_01040 [Spirochaetia bacterium]
MLTLTHFSIAQDGGQAGGNGAGAGSFGSDQNSLNAAESFRIAVEAYNRFAFNESILTLEQALFYKPGEPLILDWLGRAYYRSGMENIALRQWQAATEAYGAAPESVLIGSRIESVRARMSLFSSLSGQRPFVEIGHFSGVTDDGVPRFKTPTEVLPLDDGSAWIVCYGSNEIVRLDVNGIVRQRERGPLTGFDRPYALVRGLDGRLYLSEFRGGRVSVLSPEGAWLSSFGGKGIGDGQLSGPSSLAVDEEGYIYVTEFGNRRVSKFSPDGVFIHNFASRTQDFQGLKAPTGIAAINGIIYVACSVAKSIYMFDKNGMYLGILTAQGLTAPESIKLYGENQLLVTDTKRILLVDLQTTIINELTAPGNSRVRLTGAQLDINNNLLAADFSSNEVTVLAPLDEISSGLFVQIDRVVSSGFPVVTVEVNVQDSRRRPVVGLDQSNFILSDRGRPVQNQVFLGAGSKSETVDVSVLFERSPAASRLKDEFEAAIRDIKAGLRGNIASMVSAGADPVHERFNTNNPATLAQAARTGAVAYTDRWRFDLGLRLAAGDLLPLSKKRAVLFVTTGDLGPLAFEQYSLNDLASYLANNGIVFNAIIVGGSRAGDDIKYLCDVTGGAAFPLYRRQGIVQDLQKLNSVPSGTYILSFTSGQDAGSFKNIEAEVYLLERSGRDSLGYF